MIGNGKNSLNAFGSTITLDTFNNRVFNHEVFSISKRFTIAKTASVIIVIDPLENGAFPFATWVSMPISIQGFKAGPVNIDMYVGGDFDPDGTEWGSIDRNNVGAITPHIVTRFQPTINNMGSKLPVEFQIPSNGTGASSVIGGAIKEDFLLKADPTLRYAFELTNTDTTNTVECVFAFNWFEVGVIQP